jgi:hypothetical protein
METLSSGGRLSWSERPNARRNTNNRKDFEQAIIKNDADVVGQFLADDWIIDPGGGVIDRARFLGVIKSGAPTPEQMDSDDVRMHIYGDTAKALTRTKGKFMGQDFTTQERATDALVKRMAVARSCFRNLRDSIKNRPI